MFKTDSVGNVNQNQLDTGKLDTISKDFIWSFDILLKKFQDRIYHREDSYLYEIFVWINGQKTKDCNYFLSYNEKEKKVICQEFEMSAIPVFWTSKIKNLFEITENWVNTLWDAQKLSKIDVNKVFKDMNTIMTAVIQWESTIDEFLYLPPLSETVKKFIVLKFDKQLKDFFAVKTKMGPNNSSISESHQLINDKEMTILWWEIKELKEKIKEELDQKYPNFKVAYSYVDDLKNIIERKKYIVEHNRTITSIIYDKNLEMALMWDIISSNGKTSLKDYDDYIGTRSELLLVKEENREREAQLNRFVNYVYEEYNRIYSKQDLKNMVTEFLNKWIK